MIAYVTNFLKITAGAVHNGSYQTIHLSACRHEPSKNGTCCAIFIITVRRKTMNIAAIMGSYRKGKTIETLLDKAVEGSGQG
jgi:hypothetical protein